LLCEYRLRQRFLVPDSQLAQIEAMYDPGSGNFLKPREVSSSADMFGFYIYNNVSSASNLAGGLIAGLGSLFFLSFNAIFLGAIADT
jgi:uncharacterized membrane protein SpoIIM required for sporulation